jgi:hypothetical protein
VSALGASGRAPAPVHSRRVAVTVGGLGLGIALFTRLLDDAGRLFLAQFIALLLAFDTLSRGDYLFVEAAQVGGKLHPSDVAAIARVMGGPVVFWGGLVALISAVLVGVGLYSVLRGRDRSEHA